MASSWCVGHRGGGGPVLALVGIEAHPAGIDRVSTTLTGLRHARTVRGMAIGVLGPLVVDGESSISPRDRVVLSVLVVRRGEFVAPDVLADALWGDAPPASAAKVVQGCVSRLRRLLGPDA